MQIFAVDVSPYNSALYLKEHGDYKRIIKMILESAQMLSTNAHVLGYHELGPYKPTHKNHPCTKWARETRGNANWLLRYMVHLSIMYTDKYHREHKTIREHLGVLALAVKKVPEGELTPFANCSGGDSGDVCTDYKDLLYRKWNAVA